jgi:hypothetical protein
MVSQCANPDCRRELRYLRDGNRRGGLAAKPIIDHHEGGLDNEHLYSDDSSHSVC